MLVAPLPQVQPQRPVPLGLQVRGERVDLSQVVGEGMCEHLLRLLGRVPYTVAAGEDTVRRIANGGHCDYFAQAAGLPALFAGLEPAGVCRKGNCQSSVANEFPVVVQKTPIVESYPRVQV